MLKKVNSKNISAKLKSNSISFQNKKDSFFPSSINPQSFISYGREQSPDRNSDYNLEKSYDFVEIDLTSI